MPDRRLHRLTPQFVERIWGVDSLAPYFDECAGKRIGEVWFQTDPPLSLLTKFIFTSERLSVQVHPNDGQARARGLQNGKTEMWHMLHAEPGASVALGFRESVALDAMAAAAKTGEIEQLLDWVPVETGDSIFTPAGTVHALGAGLVVVEVQQHSDTTYRLWDYGRGRELHLEDGLAVSDLGPARFRPLKRAPLKDGVARRLAACDYFVTEEIATARDLLLPATTGAYGLLIVLEGTGRIDDRPYRPGEVWLLEEGTDECWLKPEAQSRFLRTGPPDTA